MQFWNLKPCGQNIQEQMARWRDRKKERKKKDRKKIDRLVRNDKYIER